MTEKIKINDIDIAVSESGSGSPLILIHGRAFSKEMMGRVSDHYSGRFHVYSYDVRGHGESSKPGAFTMEDHVEDLKGLVGYYGMEGPAVIGLSMGSFIALKTAEKYPELFSKIVLIGTRGKSRPASEEPGPDEMTSKVFAPHITADEIDGFYTDIAGPVLLTDAERAAIGESLQDFDLLAEAYKVKAPVLVLTGEHDGMSEPRTAREVADALPNARFESIPKAGHIAFFENPERVFELMDEFLGTE